MLAMKPVIVFIMLLVPSLCDDSPERDWKSPEAFLEDVNEYRARYARERNVPNMYKLFWSNELVEYIKLPMDYYNLPRDFDGYRPFLLDRYTNSTNSIVSNFTQFEKNFGDFDSNYFPRGLVSIFTAYKELLNPLQAFIGCSAVKRRQDWIQACAMGPSYVINFYYANPGEAGSRCPPRFKGENGLCVPVDPSKHTFWGTEDQLLEDVNYMRRKYAKEFGIPNMHQLAWNESLVEIVKNLNMDSNYIDNSDISHFPADNSSSWDGFAKFWRLTELRSFFAALCSIDDSVHLHLINHYPQRGMKIRGNSEVCEPVELFHPLQTSIGCMRKERTEYGQKWELVVCLTGNMGQWPSGYLMQFDVNSTKVPGSECMDGYVNDDGLCVLGPPTTTTEPTTTTPEAQTTETELVPANPKNPLDEKKKEGASVGEDAELEPGQEALESSTRIYSYGPWILIFIFLLF